MLQLRAQAARVDREKPKTAVILVWLRGGLSHLESYDPKPQAPSEVRGVYGTISTAVPGMHLSDLLPLHAKIADRFTLLRSMCHNGAGHPSGSLQMLTGDADQFDKPRPIYPDWMTAANYVRGMSSDGAKNVVPNYVGVNPVTNYDNFVIAGSAYVNPAYGPFTVTGDPSDPRFEVPNIGFKDPAQRDRLSDRMRLKESLDRLSREVDRSGTMKAIDGFEAQALNLLTSEAARNAFDLSKEPDYIRDRYGRHQWGQQCLMARRLVEAGVEIITTTLDGPLCGRVQNWDDHAVNQNVFESYRLRMPYFDQAVSALIEDVYARGLDKRVLVCVTGEFGRTPRIQSDMSTGGGVGSAPKGTMQPGRDHWPNAFSQLWAGGGIETGGIIGASDKYGEHVKDRRCTTGDFLATIYRHLGIDAANITIPDFTGRPISLLPNGGEPITELQGRA